MWAFDGDHDLDAAVNLAQCAEISTTRSAAPPSRAAGPPLVADGKALVSALNVLTKPARMTREPTFVLHPRHELTASEKGGADAMFSTL